MCLENTGKIVSVPNIDAAISTASVSNTLVIIGSASKAGSLTSRTKDTLFALKSSGIPELDVLCSDRYEIVVTWDG